MARIAGRPEFRSGIATRRDRAVGHRKKALGEALAVLGTRERRIFEARQLAEEPSTLQELAAEFGISRERVRQIEVRAFQKVQRTAKIAIGQARTSSAIH
jgi:RNA polymerase sigma factor (sigma-70 family)